MEPGFSLRYGAYGWELVLNNPKAYVSPWAGSFHPKPASCTADVYTSLGGVQALKVQKRERRN